MGLYEVTITVTTTYLVKGETSNEAYENYHNQEVFSVIREEEITDDISPHEEGEAPYMKSTSSLIHCRDEGKKTSTKNCDWS